MADIEQNGQKCLIFIVVPLLRLENIKKRWKKMERDIQSIIYNICIYIYIYIYIYVYIC